MGISSATAVVGEYERAAVYREPQWQSAVARERPDVFDKAIALCRKGGFSDILLRGDADFCLTKNFDRWDTDNVRFVFGYDASKPLVSKAEGVQEQEFDELIRHANRVFGAAERAKQSRVKEELVKKYGFYNIRLESEDLAEFEHKPLKTKKTYRLVVVRKNLSVTSSM